MDPMEFDKITMDIIPAILMGCGTLVLINTIPTLIEKVCCRRRNDEIMELLRSIKDDVAELKNSTQSNTFMFNTEDCEEEQSQADEEQSVSNTSVAETIVEAPIEQNAQMANEDKHAKLRTKLQTGNAVYLSYKKTTFIGTYKLKEDAPHGYVIEHNNIEYLTPSQFSFKLKKSLNPGISSDNGWDTVYVNTGEDAKGKQLKASLKELINTA